MTKKESQHDVAEEDRLMAEVIKAAEQTRYWKPDLPFDWATGGRQLSEEEREISRRLSGK